MRRLAVRAFVLGIAIVGSLSGLLLVAAQEPNVVEGRDDNTFSPNELTVKQGESIDFQNAGAIPHTATAADGSWDTGNLNAGQSSLVVFNDAGTFDFVCTYHESLGMVGTLVVEEVAGFAPAVTGAAEEVDPLLGTGLAAAEKLEDVNAQIPIGVKLFPLIALGVGLLTVFAIFVGWVRGVLKAAERT